MSSGRRHRTGRLCRGLALAFALGAIVLTACGRTVVHGSTSPPASFPSIDRTLFGCPDLNGVYAWPGTVVHGAPPSTDTGTNPDDALTLHPFELPNVEEADALSFDNSLGNAYYRVVARREFTTEPEVRGLANIGSSELGIGDYRCGFGWLEFRPASITTPDGASLRIARSEEGGLVIGVHWVNPDAHLERHRPEADSNAGPRHGRVDTWRWHHLPRLGERVERNGALSAAAP